VAWVAGGRREDLSTGRYGKYEIRIRLADARNGAAGLRSACAGQVLAHRRSVAPSPKDEMDMVQIDVFRQRNGSIDPEMSRADAKKAPGKRPGA